MHHYPPKFLLPHHKDKVFTVKQQVTKAEIIAAMQFASQNLPFSSADNLAECYREQFPDSVIARNLSIQSKKMSYIVAFGLGPYFTEQIVQEIKEGPSYFTLHFDETVTAQVKKQMDLLVRYWSHTCNEVQVAYLTSVMFGHAKADTVVAEIFQVLEKLCIPLRLLLSLGMDGPNVNKSIMRKINEMKRSKGMAELVKCPPSCLIHVCHNSFHKGIKQYGFNAEDLCLNLYYFFKRSSCRRSDLFEVEQDLGLEELTILRHVQSRWLSLVPALERLVNISSALKKLLLEVLPKNDKNILKNDKYLSIKKALESKEVETEIQFLISVKPVFDEFLVKFQMEEPKIHELYPSCEKLLKIVMGRLLKNGVFVEKNGRALKEIDVDCIENQLKDEAFKAMQGHGVQKLLGTLPPNLAAKAILGMRVFYKTTIKDLQKMLPLDDTLLQALTCLDPRQQRGQNCEQHAKTVANQMPSISAEEEVRIGDE